MRAAALACALLLLLAKAVLAAGVAALPQASSVQLSSSGQRTRLVIELDRPVAYRIAMLPRPLRLMVDLPEIDWRLRYALVRPQGIVTAERHGLFSPGRSRLVLDLAVPFTVAQQQLLPPQHGGRLYQLVIELQALIPYQPLPPPVVAEDTARHPPAPGIPLERPYEVPPPVVLAEVPPPRAALPAKPAAAPVALPVPPVEVQPPPAPVALVLAPPPAAAAPPAEPPPPPSAAAPTALPELPAIEPAAGPPPSPVAVPGPLLPTVIIDPGHGGVDPGTIGVGGVREKDVVLAVALATRDVLQASGRYQPVLTRDGDSFLRLRERIALAREAHGDIFISFHADSLSLGSQRGASIYTLSDSASDEEAARLAGKENRSDVLASTDLSHHDPMVASILIDLAQRETNNRSIAFAELLADELGQVAPLVHRGQRSAGFAVLKSPDIPSVLIELGYLSNPEEAHNLTQPGYRAALASAVLRALDRQFGRPRS